MRSNLGCHSLNEKTQNWVVTGAAGGLGKALLEKLARAGHEVVAIDKDLKGLESLYDAIEEQGLRPPALYPMDLVGASVEDYDTLARAIQEELGSIHHLIHGAAIFKALRPMMHQPISEWLEMTQVSIHSPLLLTQALMPLLDRSTGSSITFVIGGTALEQGAHWGSYGMSQAAREWMARTLALELGPKGPRVRAWRPPVFYSDITAQVWPAKGQNDYVSVGEVAEELLKLVESETKPKK